MLLLSTAKWCDLPTSQLLVYKGDKQAPPDLLNLLPEGIDLDPNTYLTRHMIILAFLPRNANTSNIQQKIFYKESVHIYKILRVLDTTKFHPNVHIVCRPCYTGEITRVGENPQLGKIWLYLLHQIESYATYTPILNGRSLILTLNYNLLIYFLSHFSYSDPTLVIKASVPLCQQMA
jgi:hypothetical protein